MGPLDPSRHHDDLSRVQSRDGHFSSAEESNVVVSAVDMKHVCVASNARVGRTRPDMRLANDLNNTWHARKCMHDNKSVSELD